MNREVPNEVLLMMRTEGLGWAGLGWSWGQQPAFLCQARGGDLCVVVLPITEQAELLALLVGPYVQLEQDPEIDRLMCCLIKHRSATSDVFALFSFF